MILTAGYQRRYCSWPSMEYGLNVVPDPDQPSQEIGVNVTPSNNAKGSWAELVSAANNAFDVQFVMLSVACNHNAAANRSTLLDLGLGGSGSEVVRIPDLNVCRAAQFNTPYNAPACKFAIPIQIPSGTRISARAAQNNGTPKDMRVVIELFGGAEDESHVVKTSKCITYGVVSATSRGTEVADRNNYYGNFYTGGFSGYEDAYTTIGTTTQDHLYWDISHGRNTTGDSDAGGWFQLLYGDANKKHALITDMRFSSNANGACIRPSTFLIRRSVPSGSILYMRGYSYNGLSTEMNFCVHGYSKG